MHYTTQIAKSAPGLTQHEALLALQNNRNFKPGTKIASIHNQAGHWVAKLMVPKTAGEDVEPCEHCEDKGCQHCKKTAAGAFEDIDESPADLHEDKHEKSESPLEEMEEHAHEEHEEKHEQSEEKKIKELEKKIDLLLDALGISEKGESPDVKPEGPSADLPAAPAPKGGPAEGPKKSEPLPPGSGAKLKPGEVPNKPGVTPVGAPSFASVKTADMSMPPTGAGAPVGTTESNPAAGCQCGQTPCVCGANANAASPSTSTPANAVTSFTASKVDADRSTSIRMAKAQLENEFEGFRVARIKRAGDTIHARMEREAGPRWDAVKDAFNETKKEIAYPKHLRERREKMINDAFKPIEWNCSKCGGQYPARGSCSCGASTGSNAAPSDPNDPFA